MIPNIGARSGHNLESGDLSPSLPHMPSPSCLQAFSRLVLWSALSLQETPEAYFGSSTSRGAIHYYYLSGALMTPIPLNAFSSLKLSRTMAGVLELS